MFRRRMFKVSKYNYAIGLSLIFALCVAALISLALGNNEMCSLFGAIVYVTIIICTAINTIINYKN